MNLQQNQELSSHQSARQPVSSNKFTPYLESVSESTMACLVTMVQGNLLALGFSHLVVAAQTGIISGVLASTVLLLANANKRWMVSITLGVITGVVDFFVHPAMFESAASEAIVTGIGAAVLSYAMGRVIDYYKSRRLQNLKELSEKY